MNSPLEEVLETIPDLNDRLPVITLIQSVTSSPSLVAAIKTIRAKLLVKINEQDGFNIEDIL